MSSTQTRSSRIDSKRRPNNQKIHTCLAHGCTKKQKGFWCPKHLHILREANDLEAQYEFHAQDISNGFSSAYD